jgi:hypothetical protein
MDMKTAVKSQDTQQIEPLPPEIVEFCALLARILHRCIQEQDPQILSRLGFPSAPTMQSSEVTHEHAA